MLPDFHANTHQPTKFDLVLHIGVSRPGSILNFELRARKAGYEKKDWHNNLADIVDEETGQRGFADPRYQALPDELHSPFLKHADEVVSKLKGDGVVCLCASAKVICVDHISKQPIVTSTDAGLFLCEFIFYCSMAESQLAGRKTPVVFIHCPPVDDPMSTEAVADGVKRIIREVCSHSEFDSQI